MSKLSFRARALDASKPMPIYLAEELPDLPDYSAINRAVPQMPSGMEKEEESEHHLQRAISGTGLIIPTPEVCEVTDLEFYERCYPCDYKMPKQHIHMQPLWEEQEAPEYDIDSEDERWLKQQRHPELTELLFEQMMDKLEKCSGQTVVTLSEAKLLLERKDDLVIAVYDYWLNKRLNTQHPLILSVKTESRPGQSTNNPYLAFRRRTEKMQTRKNRKNDESSYEKMLKLRRDLARALSLLQLVARREQAKRDLVRLTAALAAARYAAGDFTTHLPEPPPRPVYTNVSLPTASFRREPFAVQQYTPRQPPPPLDTPRQREKRPYKRRKHRHHMVGAPQGPRETGVASSSSEESSGRADTASPPDPGPFAFRRKPGCFYEMPTATLCGDPLEPERATPDVMYEHELDERHRYTLTSINQPYPRCIGFARRRVGRGGRVLLDRVCTPLDDLWPRLDFNPPHCARYKRERDEEVELETKAHRSPKEMSRDYHTSGKHPWRHAFRQHLNRNPELWVADVKPDADVKPHLDDVKPDLDVKLDLDDVKMDVDKISDLPQDSDISLRTMDDFSDVKCVSDATGMDREVRSNLESVMRKRSWSGCSDSSYDSDESLYPVEKEFEKFINEVNKKWLHFRPKTPPPMPTPPSDPALPRDAPFAVELRGAGEPFLTEDLTLDALFPGGILDDTGLSGTAEHSQLADEDQPHAFLSQGQGSVGRWSPGRLGSSVVRVRALPPPPAPTPPPLHEPPPPAAPPPPPQPRARPKPATPVATRTPPANVDKPQTPKKTPTPREDRDRERDRETRERERERDRERPSPSPVPNSNIIVEEVNEVPPQIKLEKKKSLDTVEEVVVAPGVQLKTVQTRHSPLKKHIITSAPRPATHEPHQILTVAVSDSLKVRLQNHLLSSQAGGVGGAGGSGATVVGLVQNGPFAGTGPVAVALPVQASHAAGTAHPSPSVATAGARRVPAPLVQLSSSGRVLAGGAGVVLAPSHTIHHVAPNKLKVLHAHPLTHTQRTQLLAQNRSITQLPAVVSLATLGDAKTSNAALLKTGPGQVTQLFEIKGGQLGKGAHLVNVVRQPAPSKPALTRLDLHDSKKRQLLATFDASALKGNLATSAAPTGPSRAAGARVNVSVEARGVVRAALPALRAPQLRHQIHLKNRTFQVAAPIARAPTEASTSLGGAGKAASIPGAVVANLIHKNVQLPKGGQKIAISGAGGVAGGGVQAIAFTAAQLKARQARLIAQPRPAHHNEIVEASPAPVATSSSSSEPAHATHGTHGAHATHAADGDDAATNGAVRRRPNDTLPMEVT